MPLNGYKTYLVVTAVVLIAVAESLGLDVPGAEMQQDWLNWVLGALGLGALRNGVANR